MSEVDVGRHAARAVKAPQEILVTVFTTVSRTVMVPAFEYRDRPADAVDYAIQEVDAPEADGWECSGEYDGRMVEP